ncbi:hypothetical protein [Candidatus Entotheonella palauensis]|uniref:hypothetical protein n=1 Tax=Candidatus Entotheonella palauensis TaxID=93172 RepID=UPI000B80132B|nr:hypothetical protein [Candidatus Entotheonella palauensis]
MPRKNTTTERLSGLPFASASELKTAQREILLAVWARLEQARVIDELTKRDEYQFWREEFAQGLVCAYDDEGNALVRVFSDSPGIKIAINRELVTTIPTSENIVGVLVKAMSESFANTYYKAKGLLPPEPMRIDDSMRGVPS